MSRQEILRLAGVVGLLAAALLLANLASATEPADAVARIHDPAPLAIHRGTI